jgi:hypothetical protein
VELVRLKAQAFGRMVHDLAGGEAERSWSASASGFETAQLFEGSGQGCDQLGSPSQEIPRSALVN